MIPLPANYLSCVEALVGLMRQEGKTYLSASDGDYVYRVGLLGSSIQIHVTHVPRSASMPATIEFLCEAAQKFAATHANSI